MQFATLLFYAIGSFFLGVIATQNSGAISVGLGQPANLQSPVVGGIIAVTIAAPILFVALALWTVLRGDAAPGVVAGPPRSPGDEDEALIRDAFRRIDEPYRPPDR